VVVEAVIMPLHLPTVNQQNRRTKGEMKGEKHNTRPSLTSLCPRNTILREACELILLCMRRKGASFLGMEPRVGKGGRYKPLTVALLATAELRIDSVQWVSCVESILLYLPGEVLHRLIY